MSISVKSMGSHGCICPGMANPDEHTIAMSVIVWTKLLCGLLDANVTEWRQR